MRVLNKFCALHSVLWNKVLSILLLTIILVSLATLVYILAFPKTEKFTEFYVLGPERKAENYPRELSLGQKVEVIVGIVNWEYKPVSYGLEIVVDGRNESELGPISLMHNEKWEQPVIFIASKKGFGQKVEFNLYADGDSSVYRFVYLWIDVNPL